jgi:hypothetical protein
LKKLYLSLFGCRFSEDGHCQMSASLARISKLLAESYKFGKSAKISEKAILANASSGKKLVFLRLLTFAKFTCKWALLNYILFEFHLNQWKSRYKEKKQQGTVACAVILATGTVDIGCLRW